MSIQSEIDRIEQNIANTYTTLSELGADMPTPQNSDNLAQTVGTAKAVLYIEQTLTEEQQTQARRNIGAPSSKSIPDVPSWALEPQKPSYTKSEVGLGNVDNVKQYSASNPPPYPVTKVNGKTGAVSLSAADVGAVPATSIVQDTGNSTTEVMSQAAVTAEIDKLSNEKVDKNQGAENVGKILAVGTDGNLVLIPVPEGGADGDVIGTLDESNNILLTGDLADGTYTIKYEMDNGSVVNIGSLVVGSIVYVSVTNNLTNCTNSNIATQAVKGESYSATITPSSGYELSSVVVTMGGNPVTVSGGVISIAEVTGDIVITAVAEEIKEAEPVTENIALVKDIRIGSDGTDRDQTGYCATEYIDLSDIQKPCTIHLIGAMWSNESSSGADTKIRCWGEAYSGEHLIANATYEGVGNGNYITVVKNGGSTTDVTITVTSPDIAKVRFSGKYGSSPASGNFDDVAATLTYTPES